MTILYHLLCFPASPCLRVAALSKINSPARSILVFRAASSIMRAERLNDCRQLGSQGRIKTCKELTARCAVRSIVLDVGAVSRQHGIKKKKLFPGDPAPCHECFAAMFGLDLQLVIVAAVYIPSFQIFSANKPSVIVPELSNRPCLGVLVYHPSAFMIPLVWCYLVLSVRHKQDRQGDAH